MARMNVPPQLSPLSEADAKAWAKANGIKGEIGGWLRMPNGRPLAQGFEALRRFLNYGATQRFSVNVSREQAMTLTPDQVWMYRCRISTPGRWVR